MRKAFALSLVWHLFWISSITIVSFPAKVRYPRFSEISFLGSLLDEPSFEVHVAQRPFLRGHALILKEQIRERSPLPDFSKEMIDFLKRDLPRSEKSWRFPGEFLGLKKKAPVSSVRKEDAFQNDALSLGGPASSRILYYRPPLPELPKWFDARDVRPRLELRFWISERGKVMNIETVTSSGDPTLDLIGMRHLRRWQFNPKVQQGEEEWGTVTLNFPFASSGRKK